MLSEDKYNEDKKDNINSPSRDLMSIHTGLEAVSDVMYFIWITYNSCEDTKQDRERRQVRFCNRLDRFGIR